MGSSLASQGTGRRERQKADRERRIVRAARRLFGKRGFGASAMEDVAEAAGLAVGTIYNYFPSKTDLLLAIIRRETDEVLTLGRAVVENPPADPAHAIGALADAFAEGFAHDDRELWRELMSAAIASPETIGRRLFEADISLIAQFVSLIERLKARGDLSPGLDSARAASTVYGVCLTWCMLFFMSSGVSIEFVRDEIRRAIEIMTQGMLSGATPRTEKES